MFWQFQSEKLEYGITLKLKNRLNALIIINPKSGSQEQGIENKIKNLAQKIGWVGDLKKTTKNLSAQKIAANAIKNGIKHIVVGGGDGTVREVLSQTVNNKITVGIIPLGTGNIFAKNMNIPINLEESIKIAFNGKVKKVDIGEANGNFFVLVAGMGLDVDAMSAPPQIKSKLKTIAYVFEGLKHLPKKATKYKIVVNNKINILVRAKSIMVANIGTTEAGINIVPGAKPQSGNLKIGIIKASSLISWFELIINAFRGKIDQSHNYQLIEANNIMIIPVSKPKPYECDGDTFPAVSKLKIKIYPSALSVLVP